LPKRQNRGRKVHLQNHPTSHPNPEGQSYTLMREVFQ
jgi:hypothetical protein